MCVCVRKKARACVCEEESESIYRYIEKAACNALFFRKRDSYGSLLLVDFFFAKKLPNMCV